MKIDRLLKCFFCRWQFAQLFQQLPFGQKGEWIARHQLRRQLPFLRGLLDIPCQFEKFAVVLVQPIIARGAGDGVVVESAGVGHSGGSCG